MTFGKPERSLAAIVKVRYAINFALACEEIGFDPTDLLQKVQIDEQLLRNPEAMIAEHQLWTLVGLVARETGKFDIGRDAGRISSLEDHGALQEVFREKTLFERLVTFCELARLEYSDNVFFVRRTWNGLVFGREAIDGEREQVRQVELYVLELLFSTVRSVLGLSWEPKVLNLQSDHHEDLETIIRSPDTKLRFSQPETEVFIDRNEIVLGALLLPDASLNNQPNVTRSVVELVRTYLFDPRLSLTFIARLFDVNARHLQRELQKEGTSFSQILKFGRTKAAMDLLSTSDASIFEISRSLGYSNQAHFTRAFLNTAGTTPSEFRRGVKEREFGFKK